MGTNATRARRGAAPSALANERGMLLVITMIVLLVVSTLAATNLVNAFLERSLAQNTNNASIALNAADGGINAGIAWLNDRANITNTAIIPTTPNPWTRAGDPTTRQIASGGAYRLTLAFKADDEDQDGNPATTIVLFNQAFGYGNSHFTGGVGDVGYPVITVKSEGYLGGSPDGENRGLRVIEMDVARNKFNAQVEGAFTARAGVTASGSASVNGNNHDLDGNPGPTTGGCNSNKPGVTVDVGNPAPPCGSNISGNPCSAVYDPTAPGKLPIQKTPWGVLGITRPDFEATFTKRTTDQLLMPDCYNPATHEGEPNYVWFAGTDGARFNNASACNHYTGIIVIHNENFDPDQWEARCFAGSTDAYCTVDANADGDADNAPAEFNMEGNVSWTGIVIADQVVKVTGTPTIRGGIISLASGGVVETDITGSIDIEYSCEAISAAANQGYKTRLGWHRVR